MKPSLPDATLPWWIEHGQVPPPIPVRAEHDAGSFELTLCTKRTLDGHTYASWRYESVWDQKPDLLGARCYIVSRAPVDDLVAAALSHGFVHNHRRALADGVTEAELLITFMDKRIRPCQLRVWLGDTPLIRGAIERSSDIFEGWMRVCQEDQLLLNLVYGSPGVAAEALVRDRFYRSIDHALLTTLARSLGIEARLAAARAQAEKLPDD
jgi:hypothetical protein